MVTARSGLVSPFKSPMAKPCGPAPVLKSFLVAKTKLPSVLKFCKTETVVPLPEPKLVTTMSDLPSPSRSLTANPCGAVPTV